MNINLTFTLDEMNGLLTALGQLPYVQSANYITMIHNQAVPQIQAYNEKLAAEQATIVEEPVPVE
jgi:hypothetical protein